MNTTIARAATRTAEISWPLRLAFCVLALAAGVAALRPAAAQDSPELKIAAPEELAELVGPIALYPDDLVAIVLPASTYPLQIVQAARFLEERKSNPNLTADEEWDDSIVALLNYPEVVKLLNDDLDWTYDLGTAVLNQRADVLDAIQAFRDRASDAGNLTSDERQTVTREGETIAITPADPKVIYVPYYEPAQVVVRHSYPVYYYYPWSYPVYYYPYPTGYHFSAGFFWGVTSWFSIGWHSHHVHVYDYYYHAHPYYGFTYYQPYYYRHAYANVNVNVHNGYVWEPYRRYGGRPVVRGYEGRVYTADAPPRSSYDATGSAYRSRSSEGRTSVAQPSRAVPNGTSRGAEGRASTTQPSRASPTGQANSASRSNGARAGTAPPSRAAPTGASRETPTSAYRNRSIETTERARQSADIGRPSRTTGSVASNSLGSQNAAPRSSSVSRGNASRGSTASPRSEAYRSGGLPQATAPSRSVAPPSRSVAPPNRGVGANPASPPRASTGMPRESSRGVEMRSAPSASSSRAPSTGGAAPAPRGDSAGRASGGGSYRSSEGSAARGGSPGGRSR
jgi:hypothetical protein